MIKKVVIPIGDPAGCGPIITLKAIENIGRKDLKFIIVGDKKVLETIPTFRRIKKKIELIDLNTKGISKLKKGRISKLGGIASISYLNKALEIVTERKISSLVTAPLSKEAVKLSFPSFLGHTEYLANYFGTKNFAMMMVSKNFKVVLFTRHIAFKEVALQIKKKELIRNFHLVYYFLKERFKIDAPRIGVCSLNPHAGVDTYLGKEERVIKEAIDSSLLPLKGPYPADTIFIPTNIKKFHCIVALYHDQGMIPFKLLSFKKGVNLTVGLPIIRTSPAHGVAFDRVREGKHLVFSSMVEAIRLGVFLSYSS
ncbi:MAG: hypothetical protein DRP68_03905 [Candidatus Omnitrophota bacterium]|nr:MAG: hypothetical protein DRP68_03905 [Candidatus Omnitrophota bacterium]RKY38483.1 MAG: hypothetical protein DRP72_01665 [Candidatus Omnitrophota bacterium]RKY45570.1 MAG: hypothetical protein DRP81_03485 [Candidatus Omnitrophota bacterium]